MPSNILASTFAPARRTLAALLLAGLALAHWPAAFAQNAVNTATVTPPATVTDPNSANNAATDSDPITRTTNLSLAKTASPNPVVVGQALTYTLTVSNGGPSAILASDTVSIVESLPAGLTGCAYTPSAGTFNVGTIAPGSTGTGTWTGLAVPSGGSATLTITCSVSSSAAASITNVATVVPPAGVTDPDCSGAPVTCAGNNTSSVGTTVNRPQLTLTKTASASPWTVGVPASYTLQLSNTGTAATTAVSTITDTIPAGLTIGTLPAGCSAAGQTVTCTVAAGLAAGGSTSFVIPVTPTLAAGTSVTNTATVSGGGDPTCPADARCTSTAGPTPVTAPQLTMTKTASAASFTVGVPASYTLQVSNTGTAATTANAAITDVIPTGLTIGTLPAGCTAAGQTVSCLIPAGLAAGGSTSFVIPVTATLAAGTSVTNTATVNGGGDGTCPADARCSSSVTTSVLAPQLTMTKTASAASFTVGVPASYTLQLSNTGTAATTAVATITDTIPAGLTIGTLPAGCSAAGQTVTCTVAAGLAAGGSTSFVIPVTPTLAAGTSVTNTATVSGGGDPTCPADARCTSTAGPTPVTAPQLTMTKTASAASFTVGVPASYTLQVSNTGTAATTANAAITDVIPTGLTIGTLPAGCTAAGQTVSCLIPAGLAAGGSTSFVIPVTATLAAGTSVTNTATVNGGGDGTCPADARCSSSVTTSVLAPQLTMTKTASAASFTVGVPASYTLQLSNTGTAATTAVATITDTIPAGLTIGTLPAGCTSAGQTVSCLIPAGLAAGGSTSYVIPVTPTAAAAASVTNTATVSGGGDGTCPADARCTSSVTTDVNRPNLNVAKVAGAVSGPDGGGLYTVTYTVTVTNSGTATGTYGSLTDAAIFASTVTIQSATWTTSGAGAPAGNSVAGDGPYTLAPAGTTIGAGVTHTYNLSITFSFNGTATGPLCAPTPTPGSGLYNAVVLPGVQENGPATDNAACLNQPSPPPRLTMTKTASAATFTVGVPSSYTLSVQNTGGSATTAVATITDTIPTGLTIGTLPAGCSAAGQTVTCTIPAGLAATASTSFVIPVTATTAALPSVTNTATANGGGDGTCPADARCTSSVTTSVVAPQLTLAKSASASPWTIGVAASYTLQLSNTGTAATTAVATISDTIPAGLTIGTLPAGCAAAGQTVTCTVPAGLAAGGSTSFVIPVTPTVAALPSVTNTATVSGGGDDTCPADARCTAMVGPTPIGGTPALTLEKDAVTPTYSAIGEVIAYTYVVSNTGDVTINNITVVDDRIPTVTCPATTLAPGADMLCTGSYTIVAADLVGTPGTVTNIATANGIPVAGTLTPDTDTVTITEAANAIDAVDDDFTVTPIVGTTGGTTASVLGNDTLAGGAANVGVGGNATLTPGVLTSPPAAGSITMNPDGTITVAPGTTVGIYTYTYTICEVLNPTNCDTAIATVVVDAAVIDAVDDTGGPVNGAAGGTAVANVLVNDTLNGAPATLANVTLAELISSHPGVTLNTATGAVDVAPGTPASTYTLVYEICEQLNPTNCAPATVTVIVFAAPIVANPDSGTVANGAVGGTAVANVLANDTLNGAPATLATVALTQTATTNPNVTLNPATGAVNVAPGTPAGTYTVTYRICEQLNPTNCDVATVTVTVNATVIDAANDSYGPIAGASGATTGSVLVNDTINGGAVTVGVGGNVTLTPGAAPTPASGSITMNADGTITVAAGTTAGTYTYPYTICEALNPTNCDTATATIVVSAAVIDAVNDTGTVANGATGGTAVPNVLVNDTLNGAPATLANVVLTQTSTTNPNVTLNPATGAVNVAPGTPAGTYTVTYQICEQLNPTNCDTATVTVTVPNAPPVAVNDAYTVVQSSTNNVLNVLVNDSDPESDPIAIVVTSGTTANGGTYACTATNCTYTPAVGFVGVDTFTYTVCDAPSSCSSATVTLTVEARRINVTATPVCLADAAYLNYTVTGANFDTTGLTLDMVWFDSTSTIVRTDSGLPLSGQVLWPGMVVNAGVPTDWPGWVLVNGLWVQAPDGFESTRPSSTVRFTVNPTEDVVVTYPPASPLCNAQPTNYPPVAQPDSGSTVGVTPVTVTVLANDSDPEAGPLTVTVSPAQQPANGTVVVNPDGTITYTPDAGFAGTVTFSYTITDAAGLTATTTVTITVTILPIVANDDDYSATPVNGASGGSLPTVLTNDTLNGGAVTVGGGGNVTLTPGAAPTPAAGSITMNADGTITVAAGTTAGIYTYSYTICEILNPTNCDTATATIVVDAAPIDAVNDTGVVANGATGGTAVPNVLVNDTLNGAPATLANVTLSELSSTHPGVTLNTATGAVDVAPGTPASTYTLVYEICEQLNPTNCDTATVTVIVTAAPIVANPDSGTVANGAVGGTAVANVLANDTLNGVPATLATVVLTQTATTNPNVTLNPATGAVNVAPGTPAGTYTVTYRICEQLNPTNCDVATVTVTVNATVIDAVDDSYGPIVGASGATTASVLVNDTINGGAVTVGVGGNVTLTPGAAPTPAAGSITMNADGTITVAAGTTAGTYAYPYTICDALNPTNCDTATATIVVSAAVIDAVNDTGTVANGAAGGTAVPNVLVNDTLNGAPATLANVQLTQTATTNPSVTLDPGTGAVNVAPGTPAGTYTVTYQICEQLNPTNCDTATVTVTVGAAPIDAVNDPGTVANGATGGTAVPNVLVNDTLNGAPATLATVTLTQVSTTHPNVTLDPGTGAVNVAPGTPAGTYTLVYQICEQLNPTNCDTATATVTVGAAPIDAVDDDYSATPVNGASGGSLPTVLTNDTLNGGAVTVGGGGNVTLTPGAAPTPAAGSITMNADGTITVATGTTAGVYTYSYTICEVLNPTNCDTATATIVVDAALIDAVDDTGAVANGASGGNAVPNVLVNDTLNGAPATLANVTLAELISSHPGVTLNTATGAVDVAVGTPAGIYTLQYEICEILNPANCDVATVTVTVGAALIDAVADSGTVANGAAGGTAVANVLVNDTLNGAPATPANVVLTQTATTNPNVTLNPATGAVSVAPGTPAGTYTVTYQICEQLNPTNCDTATVNVTVGAAPIDAVNDTGTVANGAAGGTAVPNVLVNDTLNGAPATLANVTLTQTATTNPNVTLDPGTGAVSVAPGTPAGTYTVTYQICEQLNPTNCDTATATVTVGAAPIDAVNDTGTVANGAAGGTAVPNVLVNDTLNGAPATLATVTLTQVSTTHPNVTLNPATGAVNVAPGTPAGTYTVTYQICEQLNPTNCDTATVTVTVGAAPIDAVNDTGTVANGASGGVAVPNVLVNDTLNAAAATLANVTLTQVSTTNPNVTLDPGTGAVNVAPGTPAGTYTLVYQICEQLNPTNCDTATVTVTVGAAPIDAVDDDFTGTPIVGASGGSTPSVLVNDTLNGGAVTVGGGGNVTLTPGAAPTPASGSITMNADGTITVAAGTTAGLYTYDYTICEVLNPTNCDTATATLVVDAAVIVAVDDTGGPVNGATGGTAVANVLVNDTLDGAPATLANVTITQVIGAPAGVTLNPATGAVNVAPGTSAGLYTFQYEICENLNPGNCAIAQVSVTVTAAPIVANPDTGTVANGAAGGTAVANVLANDTLNGAPATLANVVLTQTATTNPNVTLNPTTGAVNVAPGTPAGTYTVTYRICEQINPANCSTTTVTVTVGAAPIDAVDDSYGPVNGASGGNTASVLVNDTLGGNPATVGGGGNVTLTPGAAPTPASGSITMNADGTITVAAGTTAGTYAYPYTICEILNPTNCDTATATIVVSAAVIDAVNDTGTVANGASGGVAVPNVLVNDTLNAAAATLANVTLTQVSTTNPNVTLNPATGAVNVAPGTPAGTYTVTYRICEQLNPTNCDTATVTVTVGAAVIDAVNDTGTVANGATGGVAVPNVLVNDTLNAAAATLANVTLTQVSTTNPNVTLNPATGAVNVAPGTPAGTYTLVYQICEQLNPTNCDTATVTVTVGAAPIDAVNDTGTVANGASGGVAVPNVLVNDTLNAAAATLANVTLTQVSTTNPNVTLDPGTGAVNVAPGTPAGTYTLVYQICEQLNPTNCDTATVTVTVGAAPIDAVDDDFTGTPIVGASGGSTPSVLVNDTLNGGAVTVGGGGNVTLTPGAAPTPASGSITMNADGTITVAAGTTAGLYTYDYTICEVLNPTNCDTATATLVVDAAVIVAVDDTGGPVNGATGGTAVANVLVNDTLDGAPATLANVTITQVIGAPAGVTLNPATGAVNVAPGTSAGLYTFQYEICENLNPGNCAIAQVSVTVTAAPIVANPDTGTVANGAAGGTAVANVLANDTLNGAPATLANVVLTQTATTNPNVTLNPTTGAVNVAPGTPAGTYTVTYRICEQINPANCSTTTVTVTVGAAPIDAVDDSYGPVNGASGGNTASVLVNDTLNAAAATLANVTLTQVSTTNPNVTLNPATGAVNVAPGTPAGTYTLVYQICEQLNPTNCDTATVTVTVGAAPIDAVNDTGTVANGASGGVAVPNVLVNDTLNGAPATLATVTLTQVSTTHPNVTLNPATGAVNVAPGTPAGTYTVTYQICEQLNPTNCDTATVTVTVGAAPIDAVDDDYSATPVNGASGGSLPTVLTNDTLNGGAVTVGGGGNVTLTPGTAPTPAAGSITMNADGTITVATGTTAGVYTYSYTICEVLNPTNCDTATATIVVDAAVIDAVDDAGGPINGATGGTAVANVLVNDTLNGAPATLANVVLQQLATTHPNVTLNPATGEVNVAPGTPAGTYTVTYEICEVLNPLNCDSADVVVTVTAAPIVANPDTGTVANGAVGGTAVANVLVNDTLNGGPATLATVVLTQTVTTNPNVTLNPATGAVSVAPGTPAGTYTVTYQICEQLNPTNCSTTTVTVTVGAAVIDAVDDSYGPIVGATGGTTASVLVNDTLNGGAVTVGVGGNVTLTPGAAPAPASGSITMNADGTITIAAGTTAGTYAYPYTICEVLNPTNCDTATVTVTVGAAPIDAVNDTGTVANGATGGTAVPNVLVNDTLNGAPATLATVTLTQVSTTHPNVTLNPATGAVNVAPGTPAGTYTLVYQICEQLNPTNCDTATVTVTVGAAPIDAVDDDYSATPVNGASGGSLPTVLVNDTLGGNPVTVGVGGNVTLTPGAAPTPAAGSITMNADGTITVAAGTTAGIYTYSYTICEVLNPTNCDTATATIVVAAAVIDAVDDTGTVANGATGGVAVPNVLVNDTLNGAPATLATVTLAQLATTHPNVTLNPATGEVNVAPGTPAGTYTVTYEICEVLNPTNCDVATVTVTVGAAPIDAVNDTGTVANGSIGGVAVPNVLVNDTLNGAPATLANVVLTQTATTNPNVTLNPATGAVSVAPGTPAGTYTVTYQICEQLNPTNCDTAAVTVTVGAAPIDAVDDDYSATPVNGASGGSLPTVLVNDTLGGNPVTVGVGGNVTLTPGAAPAPAAGSITMNADGTITIAAGTTAGVYTYSYTICEVLNPTNCDTATATIVVAAAVIDAVDDTGTVANGATGGTAVPNVLVNDTLNGAPATLANVVLTQTATTNPNVTLNPATGAVNVAPGTPAGTYTLVYQICEQLNPTNCDTATATVTVGAAVIDAVDDNYGAVDGVVGTTTASVLVNDTLGGGPATVGVGGNVTLTPGAAPTPTSGSITMNADGTITVGAGTEAGTYLYPYTICEVLNPSNCDTATATVVVLASPALTVDKTASAPTGNTAGSTIAYAFLVTNTGNVTVSGLVINDPLLDAPATCAATTLAPGASTTCSGVHTITQAEVDAGVVNNTATATGSLPGGGTVTSPPDSTSTPIAQTNALGLVKSSPTGSLTVGSTITYTVTATNTGNTTQTNVLVSDPMLTPNSQTCASVAPGGTCVLTGTYVVQQSDIDAGQIVNTAQVTSTTITTPVTATVTTPIARNPAIQATKTATLTTDNGVPGAADMGDVITYAVSVTNTGNVTMSNLVVTDSFEGGAPVTLACTPTTLAPGATATCPTYTHTVTLAEAAAGGTLDNTVVATATSTTSSQTVSSTSTAVVALNNEPVAIRVVKTASPRDVKVGDLVRYTVTFTNTTSRPMVDGMVIDTPPAGFTYVEGSLTVIDGDNAGRLVGTYPIRVDQIDLAPGERGSITYLLRVGPGVRPGIHTNSAVVMDDGDTVSNVATADVRMAADPVLDESLILGTVWDDQNGNGIQDAGERGIPGVRIASVEGLLVETDQYGRYHLVGVEVGLDRGRNFILKVDPSTLPPGSTFTTDNPLVRRVTPGLPVRFDFGVKLAKQEIEGGTESVELELGSVLFAPESSEVRAEYAPVLDKMATTVREHGGGEVVIAAAGENDLLAFERAVAVREALASRLPADVQARLQVTLRANPHDPSSTVVGLLEWPLIGTVLFETDRAEIRPEYRPLMARIARYIAETGTPRVVVIGHADRRGDADYNNALGMRRAKAVQEAIAAELPPGLRAQLRVDVNDDPAAPAGTDK